MKQAGSQSWSLSTSNDEAAHVCLYIRDAMGLEPIGIDVPPRLVNFNAASNQPAEPSERGDLSFAWLVWWRRLIQVTSALQLGSLSNLPRDQRPGAHVSAIRSIFDPFEEFESLKDFPPLRNAAQLFWKKGVEWTSVNVGPPSRLHGSLIPKTVAERVIEEHRVLPELVQAAVLVLNVQGKWSQIAQPRVLLCSSEAFGDDTFFAFRLKETFESGLGETGVHE